MSSGRLDDLLLAVRRAHPVRLRRNGSLEVSDLPDPGPIWRRLADARDDQEREDRLASISIRERFAMLHSANEWRRHHVAPQVARTFIRLGDRRWIAVAIDIHVCTNGRDRLDRVISPAHLASSEVPTLLSAAARSATPLDEIASRYARAGTRLDDLLAELDVPPWKALRSDVRQSILASELVRPSILERIEGASSIPELVNGVLAGASEIWYRRYLQDAETRDRDSKDPVLTEIVRRYRPPYDGGPFWETIDQGRQDWISQWCIRNDLDEFLSGGRRVEFWKRFIAHIQSVQKSRDGEVVAILFRDFAALTFVQPGISTRLVHKHLAYGIRSCDISDVKSRIFRSAHMELARYEQRGDTWEAEAYALVMSILHGQGGS